MCGLVGYFTSFTNDVDREKMAFLLMLSSTRGRDSTGVAQLSRKGHYNQPKENYFNYLKMPTHPTRFTETAEYKTMTKFADIKGWMGHTRAATVGVVNAENAHPHISSNEEIVGAHNGTLWGDYPYKRDGATDSEAIFELLSKEGELGLNKIKGAWALTYLNFGNDTFNIIRNEQRPLSYVVSGGGDFAYASEAWMLEALLKKYSMTGEVKDLKPYEKLTLDLTKQEYIKTLEVAPVEGLEAPKVTTYSRAGFFRNQGWEGAYGGLETWHYGEDWRDEEPAVQQRQLPFEPNTPRTNRAAPGTSLVRTSQQAREQGAPKAQQESPKSSTVVDLVAKRASGGASSTSSSVKEKRPETGTSEKRFLRGLPEQQRITAGGEIEVQTIKGVWINLDDFLDLIDTKRCAWSDDVSAISEKRHWINTTEFVLASVWKNDPELRHVLGQDEHGLPLQGGFTRHISVQ